MELSRRGFLQTASGLAISISLPQPPSSPNADPAMPEDPEALPAASMDSWCEELLERIRDHSVITKVCHSVQLDEKPVVQDQLVHIPVAPDIMDFTRNESTSITYQDLILDYSVRFATLDDTEYLDRCALKLASWIDDAGFYALQEQKALSLHQAKSGPTICSLEPTPLIITKHNVMAFFNDLGIAIHEVYVPAFDGFAVVPQWLWDLLAEAIKDESKRSPMRLYLIDRTKALDRSVLAILFGMYVYPSTVLDAASDEQELSDVFFGCRSSAVCFAAMRNVESLKIADERKSRCRGFLLFGAQLVRPEALGYVQVRRG